MNLETQIKERASEWYPRLVEIRRHLHQNPELSFQEYNTAKFIESILKEIGLESTRMANTGVIVLIEGKNPTKDTLALRGDIDALPIIETNEHEFVSKNEGVMHACGHDVHTTCLLGAAMILNEMRDEFEGTVKLIFQPGEEKIPGGASILIEEGVLKNPDVKNIIGQHVMPLIPAGKVGFRSGMYMASADEVYLTVKGKGGHAAMPEQNIDTVLITSHIIVALQQVVSRVLPPKYPSVLSFGKVQAHGATNVIPDEVKVEGTFRAMNEEWRAVGHEKIKEIAEGVAKSMGGSCEVEIKIGYPFLMNEEKLTNEVRGYAENYLGAENVVDLDIWMGGEDFAFYTHHANGCFYRLGTQKKSNEITPVHTSTFDIDEEAMKVGAGLMAYAAVQKLKS